MDIKTLEKNAAGATSSTTAAVKYLIDCLYVYQKGDDKALGFLGYVLSKNDLQENKQAPSGFVPSNSSLSLIKRIRAPTNQHGIVSLMGGTWEKDYKDAKPDAYELPITKEDVYGQDNRVFLKSGGRDNPYPIGLRQNASGQWKITNGLSTMVMDVRKPKSAVDDF